MGRGLWKSHTAWSCKAEDARMREWTILKRTSRYAFIPGINFQPGHCADEFLREGYGTSTTQILRRAERQT